MKSRRTLIVLLAVGFCMSVFIVPQARANPDVYHLQCASPTTCTQGGGLIAFNQSSVTFNIINTSNGQTPLTGEAFVAVLVPTGEAAPTGSGTLVGTFSNFSSGSIWTLLSEPGNGTDYNIGTFKSDSGQANLTVSSYTVYEFDVGAFSNCGQGTCLGPLSYSNLAPGTVIVSFLENSSGNVIDQNPNSDSITSTGVVPEPGSIALFGSGLAFVGGFLRRYRSS